MKREWKGSAAMIGAMIFLGLLPASAAAQTPAATPPAGSDEQPTTPVEEIVVTGSAIKGASDSGAIAVSIIGRDQIDALGQSSTGELLENLPQAGTFEINGAADGPNDARGDIATVNLRGLGTGNTLILLNGRRLAAHAANQDIGSTPRQVVNVNAFPSAGIDRFEVLRDGASALYGADATAGVVNTILDPGMDGTRFTVRGARVPDTRHREESLDFASGFEFNEGRTRILAIGSYYQRNGLFSSELDSQFSSVDKRGFIGLTDPYSTLNTDFRNTSSASPFGEFVVGRVVNGNQFVGQRARRGTTNLTGTGLGTSPAGVFHIQPCSFTGTLQQFGARGPDGCVGLDDSTLDVGLRYDFNSYQPNNALNQGVNITLSDELALGRQLISKAWRTNAYVTFEHDLDGDLEAFGELLYYRAETRSSRAPQPLDSGLAFLIVPASNFWNPFGPVGSVNRIAGLNTADVPTTGLDVLIQQWRPVELGPRGIFTDTETFRFVGGLRGDFGAWDWETALAYSSNETADTETNRISKTLLQLELARNTPDAINPFGGPNANTAGQWDRVRIANTNRGKTTLTTWDARLTTDDFFETWAGPVGAAFGVEWRNETYLEDRDPRLDGTIIFSTANVSGISDVVGVSPTRDSEGDRNVYSMFGEVLVPLWRGTGAFPNDLTLQVAVRGEYFDDLEKGAVKPKIALSYFPTSWFNVRAAYSQGFRVPNLVQLNRGDVSRLNLGVDDFWRAPVTLDAQSNGDAYMASVRQSNPNLRTEDTETVVFGGTADLSSAFDFKWLKDFRISFDYWRFEQTDVVGAFGDQEALALDFLLRRGGSFNPNVVRAAPTATDITAFNTWNLANPGDQRAAAGQVLFIVDPFINLDSQEADGYDFGVAAAFDFDDFGEFDVDLEVTYLNSLEVVRNELLAALANDPAFVGVFDTLAVDRIQLDGNPRWRSTMSLRWSKGPVTLSTSVRYVSGFFDTAADPDLNGDGKPDFWKVKQAYRVNAYGELRLGAERRSDGRQARLRVGVNNLLDEAPPLVDDSLGYSPEFHWLKGREVYVQLRVSF
jgi:iron complex outermembrane recepter protein